MQHPSETQQECTYTIARCEPEDFRSKKKKQEHAGRTHKNRGQKSEKWMAFTCPVGG